MTDLDTKPLYRRRWAQVVGAALALAVVGGGSAAAAVTLSRPAAVALRPAAATAPATPKATPKATSKAPTPPVPTPTKTVYVPATPTPPPTHRPDGYLPSASPSAQSPQFTNAVAVVDQYYQDITDQNYAAAWAIGGSNIAAQNGQTYDSWVAGYSTTTASIDITSSGTWSDGTVWTDISATQLNGSVNTYYGTYTVSNAVIVSASITQTSGDA